MTSLAYGGLHLPRYVPYAWVFVLVVLVLIALIFVRVYVLGDWFKRRAAHRSGQRTAHMSATCQNEAAPTSTGRDPDDDRTGTDQEGSS